MLSMGFAVHYCFGQTWHERMVRFMLHGFVLPVQAEGYHNKTMQGEAVEQHFIQYGVEFTMPSISSAGHYRFACAWHQSMVWSMLSGIVLPVHAEGSHGTPCKVDPSSRFPYVKGLSAPFSAWALL